MPPSGTQDFYAGALRAHQAGRMADAIALYGQALALEPDRVDIRVNFANALIVHRQFAEAVVHYERAIALRPDSEEIHNNLGNALQAIGLIQRAEEAYGRALQLQPAYADAHFNLGNILLDRHAFAPAIERFRRALDLKPNFANAMRNLAAAFCLSGRTADGFALYEKYAKLVYGAPGAPQNERPVPHKLRHDAEQSAYLAAQAVPGRQFHLADGSRLAGPAVNRANGAQADAQWRSGPQIVTVDNFLSEGALEKLQKFCWGSTIWRRVYDGGYLGAMAEHGLACPLLAQIADELRDAFPGIIGQHKLQYLWAFKYDSQLSGINVHADKAAVNVNFWITPDAANLDAEGGGLVVWDAVAPLDWDPGRYNGDIAACRDFLARAAAKPVKIPYRCNRAVIFDSDLFHETDRLNFQDGYRNRRINITMLFGERDAGHPAV